MTNICNSIRTVFKPVLMAMALLLLCDNILAKEVTYDNPQIFDYPSDKVWTTVVLALQKSGMMIKEMNKDSGFISTDWGMMGGGIGGSFSSAMVGRAYLYKFTYSIVPINDHQTSVKIKCAIGLQNQFGQIDSGDWMAGGDLAKNELEQIKGLDLWLIGEPTVAMGIDYKYNKDLNRLRIMKVFSNTSAKKAGMRYYDLIMKINDKDITNERDYTMAMKDIKPGDMYTVTISRFDEIKEFRLTAEAK